MTVAVSDAADIFTGTKTKDKIIGTLGNDTIYGKLGNDLLTGQSGQDIFVFDTKPNKKTNYDTVRDFNVRDDSVYLDNAIFKKLGTPGTFDAPAKLDVTMFRTNKAKDKNDYLVYKGGVLYYDANGSAKGGEGEIVKVKGLKVTDIWVI